MTRKPRPVQLTLAAVIVALGISALECSFTYSAAAFPWWAGWVSQLLPHTVRNCLIWMVGCFLVMRQGETNWATRIVPIGLFVLILSSQAFAVQTLTVSPSNAGVAMIKIAAVNEISRLVMVSVTMMVISQLLCVSLRRVDGTQENTPQRFGIRTILIVTTGLAVFLTLQKYLSTLYVSTIGSAGDAKVVNVITFILSFLCNVGAFLGGIWLIASSKRRWLGLVGIILWFVAPIEAVYVLLSPKMEMQIPGGTISTFVVIVLASYALTLLGIMLTIPCFRLFGYQYRIGVKNLRQQQLFLPSR